MSRPTDYMPEDSPGEWESGTLESEVTHHSALCDYDTADVRDSSGTLHKDVTVIPR